MKQLRPPRLDDIESRGLGAISRSKPTTTNTTDPALKEVFWFVRFLYDDLGTHHTREGDAEALERPLAFLRSDEPYVWPCTRWREHLLSTALGPLTFGLSFQLPWWRIFPKPHWPFATPEQAERYCPRTRIT